MYINVLQVSFLSVLVSVSRDLKCIGVYIVLLKSSLIFVFLSASKRYRREMRVMGKVGDGMD